MPHHLKNATSIHHHIKKEKRREYLYLLTLRTLGNFLILSSLFFIARTLYEPVHQEVQFMINQWTNKTFVVATKQEELSFSIQKANDQKGLLTRTIDGKTAEILVPEDPNFSVVIPKIGANARIIPGVDTANERVYSDALKKGVAQALGTAFPGEGGHIFLFAHSTDYWWNVTSYNAVFYLLGKLVKGDAINIFYKGERYVYRVIDMKIVDPSEVEYITRKTNTEFLTLQTCWPLGTTFKRLLVFATRVAD
ncbi:MAG: sortase [Candidatus Roizmanbacteria bacterium]|nr:sortase [Candidatus Roizmanbacteria bacterium]